jgi:hypothetical protein
MRRFPVLLIVLGFLGALYFGWALSRITGEWDDQFPRPWPYPDGWLGVLNHWLVMRYPASPGFLNLDGEIETIRLMLKAWIGVCLLGLGVGVGILFRRRRSKGE